MQQAIYEQNLSQIGQIAEHNAMAMHATMFSAYPALCYWQPESLATLQQLWAYREQGLACWATMDAGANVKLIFDAKDASDVVQCFPSMQLVEPF
jgi:diphosphomevalonate decarboxylase